MTHARHDQQRQAQRGCRLEKCCRLRRRDFKRCTGDWFCLKRHRAGQKQEAQHTTLRFIQEAPYPRPSLSSSSGDSVISTPTFILFRIRGAVDKRLPVLFGLLVNDSSHRDAHQQAGPHRGENRLILFYVSTCPISQFLVCRLALAVVAFTYRLLFSADSCWRC